MRLPHTVNIYCNRHFAGRLTEDIMNEVLLKMGEDSISAIQIGYEIIRVTFHTLAAFRQAKCKAKVDLFNVPCSILGGDPPPATVHIFYFPFEGSYQTIVDLSLIHI